MSEQPRADVAYREAYLNPYTHQVEDFEIVGVLNMKKDQPLKLGHLTMTHADYLPPLPMPRPDVCKVLGLPYATGYRGSKFKPEWSVSLSRYEEAIRVRVAEIAEQLTGVKHYRPDEDEIASGSYYQYWPDYCHSLDALRPVLLKLDWKQSVRLRAKIAELSDGRNAQYRTVEEALFLCSPLQICEALVLLHTP